MKKKSLQFEIRNNLSELKNLREEYVNAAMEVMKAYGGAMYPLDLLAIAVLNRGMALIEGFSIALKNKNFICAAPLVRLHLDTLLRFFAASMVNDPHSFALEVLNGKHIRNIKDRQGIKMTDRHLVESLGKQLPWIDKVYEETSAYVHLSDKHIFSTIRTKNQKGKNLQVVISGKDNSVPDSLRLEAILLMSEISRQMLIVIHHWVWTKNNPEKARDLWDKEVMGKV